MPSHGGLREKKSLEAKRAFFRAAMALFREKGFEHTSVEEIAQRAGFSRATFFNHFKTKKGVLRFYGHEVRLRVEDLLQALDPSAEPLQVMKEVLLVMAEEAQSHRADLRVILIHSVQDPEYLDGLTPARQRILGLFTELVSEAQRRGQIRQDLPAREQAFHILALYQGALLPVVGGETEAEPAMQSVWHFIRGGIDGGYPVAR